MRQSWSVWGKIDWDELEFPKDTTKKNLVSIACEIFWRFASHEKKKRFVALLCLVIAAQKKLPNFRDKNFFHCSPGEKDVLTVFKL